MVLDIWGSEKLLLFVAFAVPGFISLKAYELVCPSISRPASERLIDAVAYSCINYALLFLPIVWVERLGTFQQYPISYYAFYVAVFLVAPVGWALLWKRLRSGKFFQKNAPHPTAKPWDFIFSQRKQYWVKVILDDGMVYAGRFGSKSFASSAPADEQIYLEERWVIGNKGEFVRKIERTAGVLITGKINCIEFRE